MDADGEKGELREQEFFDYSYSNSITWAWLLLKDVSIKEHVGGLF